MINLLLSRQVGYTMQHVRISLTTKKPYGTQNRSWHENVKKDSFYYNNNLIIIITS